MTNSRAQSGAHPVGGDDRRTTSSDDHRRANPLGAYVATLGAALLFVSMWLHWVGFGKADSEQNFSSGYEADSVIPYMALLGLGFAAALIYALKRADRNQHRGLSLSSFAVGTASTLWIIFFLINPISTVQYAGLRGEDNPNVTTSWAVWLGLFGALLWAVGSFLLAKEPEGDIDRSGVPPHTHGLPQTHTQPVQHTQPVHDTQHVTPTHTGDLHQGHGTGTEHLGTQHTHVEPGHTQAGSTDPNRPL